MSWKRVAVVLTALLLVGCVSSNVSSNKNQHKDRVNDNRVGIVIDPPEFTLPDEASEETIKLLVDAHIKALEAWSKVMDDLKLPGVLTLQHISITNDQWWDMNGTGTADTRAKAEAALDAAVAGRGDVTKDGGSSDTETTEDSSSTTINRDTE